MERRGGSSDNKPTVDASEIDALRQELKDLRHDLKLDKKGGCCRCSIRRIITLAVVLGAVFASLRYYEVRLDSATLDVNKQIENLKSLDMNQLKDSVNKRLKDLQNVDLKQIKTDLRTRVRETVRAEFLSDIGPKMESLSKEFKDSLASLSQQVEKKANAEDVYTKLELDAKFDLHQKDRDATVGVLQQKLAEQDTKKANVADVYGKEHVDEKLGQKADAAGVHSKEQINTLLLSKANDNDAYRKEDIDRILENKASATDVLKKDDVYKLVQAKLGDTEVQIKESLNGLLRDQANKQEEELKAKLSLKANVAEVYTKEQVDKKVTNLRGSASENFLQGAADAEKSQPEAPTKGSGALGAVSGTAGEQSDDSDGA